VISGDGALVVEKPNADAGPVIDDVISQLVINRGEDPIPPGERLALRSPSTPTGDLSQGSQSDSNDTKFGNFHIQL
jgi:hypothetical protein